MKRFMRFLLKWLQAVTLRVKVPNVYVHTVHLALLFFKSLPFHPAILPPTQSF